MVSSREPDTIVLPSGEKATECTQSRCALSLLVMSSSVPAKPRKEASAQARVAFLFRPLPPPLPSPGATPASPLVDGRPRTEETAMASRDVLARRASCFVERKPHRKSGDEGVLVHWVTPQTPFLLNADACACVEWPSPVRDVVGWRFEMRGARTGCLALGRDGRSQPQPSALASAVAQ